MKGTGSRTKGRAKAKSVNRICFTYRLKEANESKRYVIVVTC